MPELTHTAHFAAADALDPMLEEMACPACGYLDPADSYRLSREHKVRFFCDGCGAFVTILLSDAQAEAVRHLSSVAAAGASGGVATGASGGPVAGAQHLDRA